MSQELPGWPDIHAVVADLLADLTTHPVVTSLPADLQEQIPLYRVRRVGGPDDRITDQPRVDVEAYAGTWAQALTLAEEARQRLLAGRARTVAGVLDRAETEVGPFAVPYPDPGVRCCAATYRLSLRRRTRSA